MKTKLKLPSALHNAYLDGEYELERQTIFFAQRDSSDSLLGEQATFGVGTMCQPIAYAVISGALLVRLTDKGVWHAWIHP